MALQKISNVDKRILWAIVIILVCYITLSPLKLPLLISTRATNYYNIIEALPDGALVLCSNENGPADFRVPDAYPNWVATLQHLVRKNAKIIFMSSMTVDDAMMMIPLIVKSGDYPVSFDDYGVTWVNVGWVSGMAPGLQAWAADPLGIKPYDYEGVDMRGMAIWEGVTNVGDFDLWILNSKVLTDMESLMRQIGVPYNLPPVMCAPASQAGSFLSYVNSGQALECMFGARLAAEYEKLLDIGGTGLATVDALSVLVILLIVFVFIGNLSDIAGRISGKPQPTAKVKE